MARAGRRRMGARCPPRPRRTLSGVQRIAIHPHPFFCASLFLWAPGECAPSRIFVLFPPRRGRRPPAPSSFSRCRRAAFCPLCAANPAEKKFVWNCFPAPPLPGALAPRKGPSLSLTPYFIPPSSEKRHVHTARTTFPSHSHTLRVSLPPRQSEPTGSPRSFSLCTRFIPRYIWPRVISYRSARCDDARKNTPPTLPPLVSPFS